MFHPLVQRFILGTDENESTVFAYRVYALPFYKNQLHKYIHLKPKSETFQMEVVQLIQLLVVYYMN